MPSLEDPWKPVVMMTGPLDGARDFVYNHQLYKHIVSVQEATRLRWGGAGDSGLGRAPSPSLLISQELLTSVFIGDALMPAVLD